jgi:hypothetical protein
MIKRLNCWVIANLGLLTLTGFIVFVVLVRLLFIPNSADKVLHINIIAAKDYQIKLIVLRLLLTSLTLFISIKTAIYTYKNNHEVAAQKLFKINNKIFTVSVVGYALNRFLMASVFYICLSAYLLSII